MDFNNYNGNPPFPPYETMRPIDTGPLREGQTPAAQNTPPYSGYVPGGFTADTFTVLPHEKASIKKHYSGVFSIGLIHDIGSKLIGIMLFSVTMLLGHEYRTTDDGTQIMDWFYCIIGSLPSLIMCLSIVLYDRSVSRVKTGELFRTDRITLKFTVGFFGMIMLSYGLANIIQQAVIAGFFSMDISPVSENYITETEYSPALLIAEFITTVILAPVFEELLYRGVILRRLSQVSGRFAIFISALMFGCMHGNLLQAILGLIVGIVLGYAAVKTESLVLPVAGHVFINFFAVSKDYVECLLGKDISDTYWTVSLIIFGVTGFITLMILLSKGSIVFPEYTEYHKKRTYPIAALCISFWLLMAYYVFDIVSAFGPVTDKLLD